MKFKISEEERKLFLEEAKLSTKDWSKYLAGSMHKQVFFRDLTKFKIFFNKVFEIYDNGLERCTGESSVPQKYRLDALWVNFQRPGDFNPPHDHGGSLSWVIFLDIPEALKSENTQYKGTSAGPGGITFLYGDGPRESVTSHSFLPETGDMYVFPAWLKHWVYPFKSDCTRISVSGNVRFAFKLKGEK